MVCYRYFSGKSWNDGQGSLILRDNISLLGGIDESDTSWLFILNKTSQGPRTSSKKGRCIYTGGKQLSLGENFNSSIHLIVCEFMRNLRLYIPQGKRVVTALQSESVTKWTVHSLFFVALRCWSPQRSSENTHLPGPRVYSYRTLVLGWQVLTLKHQNLLVDVLQHRLPGPP